ncbi:MAG TPA: M20/M25/M40 family metallo-hydrolase [Chitinophagales bacterium]|nr:M20/M25/M40 family metallo-hydrolase [Chitinophagales bacterium]
MMSFLFTEHVAAQLTKEELRITKSVDERTGAAIELLKKAVNINSGTMNFAGVRQVGELFMDELKKLGFETRWSPGDAFNRAGHLIAVHRGKGKGKKFLLIGHLDTVFEPDSKFQTWTMLNDSIIQGPGVSDMKGGDVIMILAMQALHDAGLLDDITVEIVMVGDEELSGEPIALSKKDIKEAALRADIALGFEDGDGIANHALISRRGSSDWTLTVKGTAAHSSQIFTNGVGSGAIYEAARILHSFYESLSNEENLTFSPGVIAGGGEVSFNAATNTATAEGKNNIVASDVIVKGDLRAVSTEQLKRARQVMADIIQQNYPHTSATIDFGDDGYPPMSLTEGNKKLLAAYSKASVDLGFGVITAVPPRHAGAADISFAADAVEMAIDALGITGADGHTDHETANLDYLSIDAKRVAVLIARLGN